MDPFYDAQYSSGSDSEVFPVSKSILDQRPVQESTESDEETNILVNSNFNNNRTKKRSVSGLLSSHSKSFSPPFLSNYSSKSTSSRSTRRLLLPTNSNKNPISASISNFDDDPEQDEEFDNDQVESGSDYYTLSPPQENIVILEEELISLIERKIPPINEVTLMFSCYNESVPKAKVRNFV